MEALVMSTALVALAEIGDKTQLLAVLLATRYRKPLTIIAGIFVATIANHFLAALVGHGIAGVLDSPAFRIAVALGFIAMGLWTLVPDKIDEDELKAPSTASVFMATAIAFFLVEMGDKTQVATVALGAQYGAGLADVAMVTMGTTLGMMIANIPAVYLGEALIRRIKLSIVRMIAAALFIALGIWMLGGILGWW
ncbi:MAG: TMEM165/GDT1 family protein [Sphingobium sp.]|nr:TMEM165/GDT1 family protein [Sphingomonas sp.]